MLGEKTNSLRFYEEIENYGALGNQEHLKKKPFIIIIIIISTPTLSKCGSSGQ